VSYDPAPFLKTATTANARARLRREADVLRRTTHPGVVSLLSLTEFEDRTELATARVIGAAIAAAPPPSPSQAAAMAAALARTVADLHELGLTHRRLTPDHVLLTPDGRPVLCGLAEAGPGDPDGDVRGLGAIFELLAASATPPLNGRETRLQRGLLALAEQARSAPSPPSASVLAQLAGALEGRHRPSRRAQFHLSTRGEFRFDRRTTGAIAFAAVGLVVAIVGLVIVRASGGAAPAAAVAVPTSRSSSPGVGPTTHPKHAEGGVAAADESGGADGNVADDDDITAGDADRTGVEIEAGGARYAVGRLGDQVVLGDWDCDGQPGAALLRPATGEVYVFDVLATPDHTVTGRPLATLPDATGLVALDQADGCTSLAVRLADGTPRVLLARGVAR
jgi:hypothetical protein